MLNRRTLVGALHVPSLQTRMRRPSRSTPSLCSFLLNNNKRIPTAPRQQQDLIAVRAQRCSDVSPKPSRMFRQLVEAPLLLQVRLHGI